MKKILLLIFAVTFFGCSDETPTAPAKEYPISYNNLADELSKKINERRTENEEQNFTYLENVQFEYEGNVYDFINTTNNYNYPFVSEYNIEVRRNETNITTITRHEFYINDINNIVESIINYDLALPSWHSIFYNRSGFDEKISINIIEIGNNYPRTNDRGVKYDQFDKHRIIVYVYNEAQYANQL